MVKTEDLKYKNWVMTWNSIQGEDSGKEQEDDGLIPQEVLVRILKDTTEDYVFQLERGEQAGRLHYQGAFKTRIRVRKKTLLNLFRMGLCQLLKYNDIPASESHIELLVNQLTVTPMQGTWAQAVEYCTKSETALGDPISNVLLKRYDGLDVEFIRDKSKRYPWQCTFFEKVFNSDETDIQSSDGRTILWIWDPIGNTGKSKLVKYCCINYSNCIKVTFGTSGQLRSAIISAGARSLYIIDMPRTLGADDSLESLIAVIEDVLNGFVCTNFHGQYQSLVMSPPKVVVFSNLIAPKGMLSDDRWDPCRIDSVTKKLESQLPI